MAKTYVVFLVIKNITVSFTCRCFHDYHYTYINIIFNNELYVYMNFASLFVIISFAFLRSDSVSTEYNFCTTCFKKLRGETIALDYHPSDTNT